MGGTDSEENLLDQAEIGRRARAARILAGYERMIDVLAPLSTAMGRAVSMRQLGAVERAELAGGVPLDLMLGLLLVYRPPGGMAWFTEAVRPDARDAVLDALTNTETP